MLFKNKINYSRFIRKRNYSFFFNYIIRVLKLEFLLMTSTPQPPPPPTPVFIQQTSKQVTFVRFSSSSSASSRPILYSGNRDGDLVVYDCTHRRAVFTANANQQAILTIVELDSDLNHVSLLTHTRNGRLFKWTGPDVSTLQFKCN